MYCVEALDCLSVYIDTEVYVYMQVYSASAAGSKKSTSSKVTNYPLSTVNCQSGHELPTVNCQLSSVNCQLSSVNCQLGVTLRATVVVFIGF